jgi:hypothetical protein
VPPKDRDIAMVFQNYVLGLEPYQVEPVDSGAAHFFDPDNGESIGIRP